MNRETAERCTILRGLVGSTVHGLNVNDGIEDTATRWATVGAQSEFIPPNIAKPRLVADIVSGTGRFAGATGTFTIELVLVIDFATATHTGTGSFEGRINLHR